MATFLRDLAGIEVQGFNGVEVLTDLLDAWAQHVLRMHGERTQAIGDQATSWGIWDLGAAYLIRDHLATLLVRNDLGEPPSLRAVDALLVSFTVNELPDWPALMNQEAGPGWWWTRIPTSGPVREEYEAMSALKGRTDE